MAGVLLLALTAGGLVTYKTSAALAVIAKAQTLGTMAPKAAWISGAHVPLWVRPLADAVSYFAWVGIALGFGLLLGAVVRAAVSERALRSFAAGGASGHLWAAVAGAPLMLCSCCVAPLFDGVFARTRRLGPSLALMLAAPGLNPAAMVLTFMLFPADLAMSRLVLALSIVLGVSSALGRLPGASDSVACQLEPTREAGFVRALSRSLRDVVLRTLPAIGLGVLASALLLQLVPIQSLGAGGDGVALPLAVLVALLVALPTFGEVPIALALLAAGASHSVALGVLVAGPIVNLPSLLTLRKTVSTRAAVATGLSVYMVTVAGSALLA